MLRRAPQPSLIAPLRKESGTMTTFQEWHFWAIGAAVVALLISIAVTFLVASRARDASAAALEERAAALQEALCQQADALTRQLEGTEHRLAESAQTVETNRRQAEANLAAVRGEVRQQSEAQAQQSDHAFHAFGQQMRDSQQGLRDLAARVEAAELQLRQLRTQAALAQAVSLAFKARTHLSEQSAGLAQHDLAALDTSLQRAAEAATNGLRPRIEEARRSLGDLKEGIEGKTFPVAAVELLADRIDDLTTA
jgi:chromosome segregation ATPase